MANAPRPRATRAQVRAVKRVVRQSQEEAAALGMREAKALLPVIQQAEEELRRSLARWIERGPDGEERFTPHSYRSALLQTRRIAEVLGERLGHQLAVAIPAARKLASEHLEREVARLSDVFTGSVRPLPIGVAVPIASGQSYLIHRVETSKARYAGKVGEDIKQRLAVEILKSSSVHEATQRLQEHGGPRGKVSLRGIAGKRGAVVEDIPEGLFRRYRWWAERIVRTEFASAYEAQKADGIRAANRLGLGLKRRWFADPSACALICLPLSGMIVGVNDVFPTARGLVSGPPAHPCCCCCSVPWADDWPDVLGDVSPF